MESIITENESDHLVKHSVITIKDSLKLAWNRIKDAGKIGKLFYVGFGGVAILIAVAVGLLSGILNMDPTNFLSGSEELVRFDKGTSGYEELMPLIDDESINYFQLVDSISLSIKLPPVYQSYENNETLRKPVVFSEYLDESKLVIGRVPNSIYEIVLDQDAADDLLAGYAFEMLGITRYEDLLNLDLYSTMFNGPSPFTFEVKIVGIVQDQAKVVYASKELVYMTTFNVGLLEVFEDDINIEETSAFTGDYQVYVANNDALLPVMIDNVYSIYEEVFTATSVYTANVSVPSILVSTAVIEEVYFNQEYLANYANLHVHSNDVDATIQHFKDNNIEAKSLYELELEEYREDRLSRSVSTIIFGIVVLSASAVSYFFILRSSLLSRIYEVSVYRALGVSKGDIRKMFTVETVFITTMTSMVGYLATTFLMYRIQLFTEDIFEGFIYISPLSIITGIVIIYVVNIIAGIIPVSNLLRKTPAEILSKYDF